MLAPCPSDECPHDSVTLGILDRRADTGGMMASTALRDSPAGEPPTPPGWILERDAMGRDTLVQDRDGNAGGAWALAGMAAAILAFSVLLARAPSSTPPSAVATVIGA